MDSPNDEKQIDQKTPQPASKAEDEFRPEVVAVENHESAFSVAGAARTINTDEAEQANEASHLQINSSEGKFKRFIKSKKLWVTVFLLLATVTALWFVRPTRTWIVNALGAQVPLAISTRTTPEPSQPSAILQKVSVAINGTEVISDEKGEIKTQAHYGEVKVDVKKAGYEPASLDDFYDFDPFFGLLGGSNNGSERTIELQLKSIGLALKFKATDWLTEAPLTVGDFSIGDVVAKPDSEGLVSIKVAPTDNETIKVKAVFGGLYVDREFELTIQDDPVEQVAFVPAGKDYFVSKRTGQLGVYGSNVDGTDIKEVVAPSANETSAVDFVASPSGKYGVLASTREGKKDSGGKLLQQLYVVNLTDNKLSAVDEGMWFDFVDWSGDTLVYTTAATASGQRLSSVDTTKGAKTDLGAAGSYGVVRVGLGSVVYQMNHASNATGAPNNPELRVVPAKGGTEKNIGNKVNVLTQSDFDKVTYQTADNAWHEYSLNTTSASNVSAPASANKAFLSATSADGQSRLVVDKVDGKNTIYTKSVANGQEKAVYGASSLRGPIRWVGSMILFRINDSTQTADYVVPAAGGTPKKIGDVTMPATSYSDTYFSFY